MDKMSIFGVSPPSTAQVKKEFHDNAVSQINPSLMKAVGVGVGAGATMTGLIHLARMKRDQRHRKALSREEVDPVRIVEKHASLSSLVTAIPNEHAQSPKDFSLFWPATGAAAGVGMYAGSKAADKVIKGIRDRLRQKEMDKAKAEYEAALRTYTGGKQASDFQVACDKLAAILDTPQAIKLANMPGGGSRLMHRLLGMYLLAIGGATAFAGMQGADKAYSKSRSKAIERANEERMIIDPRKAVPTTVSIVSKKDVEPPESGRKRKKAPIEGTPRTIA